MTRRHHVCEPVPESLPVACAGIPWWEWAILIGFWLIPLVGLVRAVLRARGAP